MQAQIQTAEHAFRTMGRQAEAIQAAAPAARSPLDLLETLGTVRTFHRDEEIYVEGDPADYCYKVVSGAVRIVKLLEDGRRQVIEFLLPGDLLGFDLLDEHESSAEAVGDTVLKCYPRRRVEALAEQHVSLARSLRDLSAHNLRRAHSRIVLLGRMNACERLATFLVEIAGRMQRADNTALDLPMTRTDIADHLGLTVETVSRSLTQFKRNNTISVNGARIAIRDRRRLEEAGGEMQH